MIVEWGHCAALICLLAFFYGLAWLHYRTNATDRLYAALVYMKSLIV